MRILRSRAMPIFPGAVARFAANAQSPTLRATLAEIGSAVIYKLTALPICSIPRRATAPARSKSRRAGHIPTGRRAYMRYRSRALYSAIIAVLAARGAIAAEDPAAAPDTTDAQALDTIQVTAT